MILKILGKSEEMIEYATDRPGHDRRYAIDSKKLRSLGWGEKFSFDSAFEETVEWYRGHENWWKAIKEKSPDFKRYYQKAYRERV